MDIKPHIAEIDREIAKLEHAKAVLLGLSSTTDTKAKASAAKKAAPKRKLSTEARAKIAEAQKKRWAATRKNS